jgi:hypothetical protein
MAKTNHDKRRGSWFATHHIGPPTLWVPPSSVSQPGSSVDRVQTAHIPLERGGAAATASSLVRKLEGCWLSPHPSREGRGSWPGRQATLAADAGGREGEGECVAERWKWRKVRE